MSKLDPRSAGAASQSRPFFYFLVITAVACGALIMVIEVLGSRVLGPFYGVSLFVWTALITVTLVALAGGYAAGGILSDRKSSPDYLYGIILLSGILVMLIPLLKGTVLKLCLPMGLRAGSLASALLLFGPSLFLLGCVSPYIVRIAAREMANIGRTVGVFYAVSTVGSFFGTLVTGFVLIAYLGVNRIFFLVGILLIVLSTAYFLFFRKKWPVLAALLFIPALFFDESGMISRIMPNGSRVTKIFEKDSFYGNLKVVDYTYGPAHTRDLMIDGLIQGGIDMNNRLSVYEYAYLMQYIPRAMNPKGRTCLAIGLGAGVVPLWYEQQGVKVDVVDIDPAVPEIAREYFGFRVSGDVIISDARYFLGKTNKHYDYIILDVFNGDTTPGHVLSREAMRLVKERLSERGILAINLAGSLKKESFMTASVVKTLQAVFQTVRIYPTFAPEEGDGSGNLAIVAHDSPDMVLDVDTIRNAPVHLLARKNLAPVIGRTFAFPAGTPAIVLTDEYNPIDFYDLWLKEHIRRNILENTDWDILI
ncbi:MAG TPA: fused MFS/spermidine synthase [Nitrospirota bacterium]|nr:fused MFS/spermidine synthase [Nitrospirota bacterium]